MMDNLDKVAVRGHGVDELQVTSLYPHLHIRHTQPASSIFSFH
jgi:hypothetical protein